MNVEEFRKQLGHRIKVRRTELNLQQKDLGELTGYPQAQISQWEQGTRGMRIEHTLELAKALNTTVGNLIGEENR